MTKTGKLLLFKAAKLMALLVCMNLVYSHFLFEQDIQAHSEVVNLVRNVPADADIVYIGESSNLVFRGDDVDKRRISAMMADFFPDLVVADITKPASHAGIYLELLRQLPEDHPVKTVVVTLNLRSFDAQWIYSDLETPLQKSLVLLRPYPPLANRFQLSFKAYDVKNKKEREEQFRAKWAADELPFPYDFPFQDVIEWDRHIAETGIMGADGTRDSALTQLASHYVKTYAFPIDTLTHPRIADFNAIIGLARERNWKLIFNLLAENHERAKELVGGDLVYLMETNGALLVDYFTQRGIPVVDNLLTVPNDQFVDQDWTTEHYAEEGRKTIARNLAIALRDLYPEQYTEVEWSDPNRSEFFNDCEGQTIWGQMHTLSLEKSHSGVYASKTGRDQDFSITLEYPFNRIPAEKRSRVSVDLEAWAEQAGTDAKIVIEAYGDDIEGFWHGWDLGSVLDTPGDWQHLHFERDLPPDMQSATLIKVYLYNPTHETVWVDDFRVTFE